MAGRYCAHLTVGPLAPPGTVGEWSWPTSIPPNCESRPDPQAGAWAGRAFVMYTERLAPLLIRLWRGRVPARDRAALRSSRQASLPGGAGGMVLWRHPVHGRAGHRAPARRGRPHAAPGRRPGKPHPQRPDHHRRVLPQARRPWPGLPARRRRLPRRNRIRSRRLRPRARLHRRRSQLRRPGRGQPGSYVIRLVRPGHDAPDNGPAPRHVASSPGDVADLLARHWP